MPIGRHHLRVPLEVLRAPECQNEGALLCGAKPILEVLDLFDLFREDTTDGCG